MENSVLIDDKSSIALAPWDAWNASSYLSTYFRSLGEDLEHNLRFLVQEASKIREPVASCLDFGSGPTIFTGLVFANVVNSMYYCDYLESNIQEISKWKNSCNDAHDWNFCTSRILQLEGNPSNPAEVKKREEHVRSSMKDIYRSDASLLYPIYSDDQRKFPLIVSNFCLDSATSSKAVWRAYMGNMFNLLEDSGQLILAALRNCEHYVSGSHFFPSACINEKDMNELLKEHNFSEIDINVAHVPTCKQSGFDSIIFVSAKKKSRNERARQAFKKLSKQNVRNLSHST